MTIREMTIHDALAKATDTRDCRIGEGTLEKLPEVISFWFKEKHTAVIVSDPRTWKAAGEKVAALLCESGLEIQRYDLEPSGKIFHAEYHYVEEIRSAIEAIGDVSDIIPIAVGSGVINDLVKRATGELKIPYMVVATAASVDGFSSFGASLVSPEGSKQTYSCPAPRAIIADLEVMRSAPKHMTAYGFADLMAKCPAGVDWILASELGAAEMHKDAWHIVQDGMFDVRKHAEGVAKGEPNALALFVEGLMRSGFAMQAMQSSRPASGAEHMFSHILDMTHHTYKGELVSHGAQVGVYTLFMARFHEALFNFDMASLDIDKCVDEWKEWDNGGEQLVLNEFKNSSFPLLGVEQSKPKWQTKDQLKATLESAKNRWNDILALMCAQAVSATELEKLLKTVGAPTCPAEIGVDNDFACKNIRFAMFMRNRYNALDFAFRIGKLDEFAATASSAWDTSILP